jgi:adenylosuccinate lyase
MIERYSRPEMAAIWSEERRLAAWLEVEALVAEGWEQAGAIPEGVAAAIRSAGPIDIEAWKARERETRHDVAAFVDVVAGAAGDHGRWVHYGLTSSDVIDTALGVVLRESCDLLLEGIVGLFTEVQRLATEHAATPMVGRTHGQWAEPTTFGHKMAGFGFALVNARHRLLQARHTVSYGTISGPVGTRSSVPADIETHVMESLGLNAEPAPTQVVSRDRHAMFLATLAVIGTTLERLATEIRHLSRSEVGEVSEPFSEGQKGSSAMPHKHNPILSENVSGLMRLLRGYAVAGMENVSLWHERDISNSSVERVALPDACLVLDFSLHRIARVLSGLTVDADRMQANLDASMGLVFSQRALNALIAAGAERDAAYRVVQEASQRAIDGGTHLRETLGDALDDDAFDGVFDLDAALAGARQPIEHLQRITPEWLRTAEPLS